MSEIEIPSFLVRIGLAFGAFFRILFDGKFAAQIQELPGSSTESALEAPEPGPEPAPEPPPVRLHEAPTEAALQLLGLLQREGRLLDFLMEDMGSYPDADIGAAARVVHDQCRTALLEHVQVARIRAEDEGSSVSVPVGFSASEIRLVGQVAGQPPFSGVLTHAGWRAQSISLPKLSDGHDVRVLAPAEVEL